MSLSELPLFELVHVPDLGALFQLVADRSGNGDETVLLAGGTDWIVERHVESVGSTDGKRPLVVDISRLGALRGISVDGDVARIGAATTYLEIRRDTVLRLRAPLLDRMARDVGAVQIQARGTLGGNLATASPAADGVAALAALDAFVVLGSVRGERSVPLRDFYTGYKKTVRAADEVIVRVDFVLPRPGALTRWRKVGTRLAQSISKVALAAVAEVDEGRVTRLGLGMASVAPTTEHLPTVRGLALGAPLESLTDALLDKATLADVAPIDDIRSTAAYRRHVACALVRGFFDELRDATRNG